MISFTKFSFFSHTHLFFLSGFSLRFLVLRRRGPRDSSHLVSFCYTHTHTESFFILSGFWSSEGEVLRIPSTQFLFVKHTLTLNPFLSSALQHEVVKKSIKRFYTNFCFLCHRWSGRNSSRQSELLLNLFFKMYL